MFHSLSIEESLNHTKTSQDGLSKEEAEKRRQLFGPNLLEEEHFSKWKLFLRQFNNFLIYILLAASLISLLIGKYSDFFVINLMILINVGLGFWQELRAHVSLSALNKLTEASVTVIRGGEQTTLSSSELVPGDLLLVREGEIVTADVRLVETLGLMVDESLLTGESVAVVKDHQVLLDKEALPYELVNMLLSGTAVVRGSGKGIVVRTGKSTYLAEIAEKAKEDSPETPLTKSLRFFAKNYVGFLITLFAFLGVVGYSQGRSVIELFYILVASLVSAAPEGLPLIITLVMVLGALALNRKKALVRYLPSVETLGSATVIACDKTGTLTEGHLIVKEFYTKELELLKQIAVLCNDAKDHQGDLLDVALEVWVREADLIRKESPRLWTHPFDTQLMLMATIHEIGGVRKLLVKGAYESLKEMASNPNEMDEALKGFLEEGLRVLALGIGEEQGHNPADWRIRIVGIIGFLDPPKVGVKEAVSSAKRAGIRVFMITGDHPMTAQEVAREINIPAETVLTGKTIDTLTDEQLFQVVEKTAVLARVLPEHKYRIVKMLQAHHEIVAVTGDGINDVPALKTADLGIAMGSGTSAAKSAARMVIADNNLSVIVEAIRNARVIADNIRKVIYYLVSTSIQEICLISLAILYGLPLPLSAIQILWVNIITDGVQDKTFPFAKADGDVMNRPPRRPEKQFFDMRQLFRINYFGLGVGFVIFLLYRRILPLYPFEIVSTIMFTCVASAQWANGIQAQKEEEPFFKNVKKSVTINPYIFCGLGLGFVLQILAIYLVPHWFHSVPLEFMHWKYPAMIFLGSFALVELEKWIVFLLKSSFQRLKMFKSR